MLTSLCFFFFFNDTATTEIYTLSLHDALPIFRQSSRDDKAIGKRSADRAMPDARHCRRHGRRMAARSGRVEEVRSEEHTSELQSQSNLVCRLLLEKKKKHKNTQTQKKSKKTVQ